MITSRTIVQQPGPDRIDRLDPLDADRLDPLDADRMAECLAFLASFRPEVFDAVVEATEPYEAGHEPVIGWRLDRDTP